MSLLQSQLDATISSSIITYETQMASWKFIIITLCTGSAH